MYTHKHQVRVRYGETDQMGYCYYGNYAQYYEVGRVEALRDLGYSYRKLEEDGIMLPVLDFSIRYLKPAYYDDVLTVETFIKEKPGARITFEFKMYNEKGDTINYGTVVLVFVDAQSMRPVKCPESLVATIAEHL